jgi:hypothetical protein
MVSNMGKNKLPASWLDDPEWEMLRRKAENRPIPKKLKQKAAAQRPQARAKREEPRTKATREDTEKEVVVNLKLSVPKIKLPDLKKVFRTHKKQVLRLAAAALAMVCIFGAFQLFSVRKDAKPTTPEEQAEQAFNPLVPLEGLTDATGKKLPAPEFKFDQEKKVLGYKSEYNGVQLTVSQQALPDQLKSHPGQLEGIARSVNANVPIDTQKGKAYIATEDKTKTQIVVFATDGLMVFIRSNKSLDSDDWIFYINQLNPKR